MNRTSILAGVGTLAATGLAVLAGIVIGDALSDDPVVATTPPLESRPSAIDAGDDLAVVDDEGEPVVSEDELGPGPDDPAPPRDTAGNFTTADPADEVSPETEAIQAVADDVAAQAEAVATGDAEPVPFEPPTDESGVVTDSPSAHTPSPEELAGDGDEERALFIDLCAGDEAGTPPPDEYGCPEDGVGGTVLAIDTDPAAELGIDLDLLIVATGSEALLRDQGPAQVPWGFCDYSAVPDGEVPVYVLATRPIDAVLEHGAPSTPAGTVELTTPPARLENIAMMVEGFGDDLELAARSAQAQVCGSVPTPAGDELELTVTATDTSGNEVTTTMVVSTAGGILDLRVPEPRPVSAPPVPPPPPLREAEIAGFDDGTARIIAPQGDPAVERVHLATVPVSGPGITEGTESCSSIQQSVFDGSRRDPRLYNHEVVPRFDVPSFDPVEIFGLSGETDPNEGLRHQTLAWMTAEDGVVYDVCVWWTGNPTSTSDFATPPIVEQRRYRVSAPDQYLVEVELTELFLWDDVEAGQFTAEIFGRRTSFPAIDLAASETADDGRQLLNALPEPIRIAGTAAADTPTRSFLTLTNTADDSQWGVTLPTRVDVCDGTDEGICISGVGSTHATELPANGAVLASCLGNGCGTATIATADQAGWATFRVVPTDPDGAPAPSRSSRTWHTTEAADFVGAPPVLPTTPRLDVGRSGFTVPSGAGAPPSDALRGTLVFDRPVTGTIEVQAVLGADDSCDRDPITIGPAPTATVVVQLTDLCRDTLYSFPTTIVDAAGNTAALQGVMPLVAFTNPVNVRWQVDIEVTAVHDGSQVTLAGGEVRFDDKAHGLTAGRCLADGYHVATPRSTSFAPMEDSLRGETFTVGATLQLTPGCDAGGGTATEHWQTELDIDLLEALFLADGPTQTTTVEVAGPTIDYLVRVTIEHLGRLTCRGGVCPTSV